AQGSPARPSPRETPSRQDPVSQDAGLGQGERPGVARPLLDADEVQAPTLRQELESLTQNHTKNVVAVLGTVVQDGKLCCVTERIDAEDLETQLKNGHRFTTEEIL